MGKDMSPVGASATASKASAGLDGNKEYDGTFSGRKSDNGGFILSLGRRTKSTRKSESYPAYCPSEELTFETKDEMIAAIKKHL